MKLNLASGKAPREGWFNVDLSADCNPDQVVNLLKFPWQFKPMRNGLLGNSVEEIYCSHFLEHIGEELIPFMEECWRVLKPGGTAHFVCPYYTSIRAWQDPTHKRPISEFTFHYFSQKWLKTNGIDHYNIKADFDIEEIRYHYPNEMKNMDENEVQWLRQHAWNIVTDFEVILKAVKSDGNNEKVDRKAPEHRETLADA